MKNRKNKKKQIKRYFLFILLSFSSLSFSQDIISDEYLSDSDISLGEEVDIEFTVNYITDEDSYSVDVDIDYSSMEIIITVDYDYDEDGDESDDYDSEEISVMPLFEGEYGVTIECDVSFDFSLDEEVDVGDFSVGPPEGYDCDASFVPLITGFCPWYGDKVCACNGITYDNECEAFFEEEHGIYFHFTCGDHVYYNSKDFKCGHFSLDNDNTFSSYDCDNYNYEGDELYLKYKHPGDSLKIYFTASNSNIRLFLVDYNSDDIECLAISDDSKLEADNLSSGTYYIIADSQYGGGSIDICDITSNDNPVSGEDIALFPNPAHSNIYIKSNAIIRKITIRDIFGIKHFSKSLDNNLIIIKEKLTPGIYFVTIKTENSILTKRISIE